MVNFKQLLEKATSGESSDPDWEAILEIVEEVKTKNTSAKNAIKEFRRRLLDNGGNVVYHTLLVLDSLMKNCASDIHSEVLSVEFLGVVKGVITSSKNGASVKAVDKALELIGEWKSAFGEQTGYKAINTVFSELEREGYHIPVTPVASAAFIKKAPEWVMADRCFMCRQDFNRFKGKLRHHCRNCGKSVCAQCSGKRASLPHFGVEEPTRVCDICYKKVEKGEGESASSELDSDLPVEYLRSSLAHESQTPRSAASGPGGGEEQEEEDLQLAIAMSLNEQENKPKKTTSSAPARAPSPNPQPRSTTPSAPPPASNTIYASIVHDPAPTVQPEQESTNDPLARYLDRRYWEQRKEQQTQQAGGAPPPSSAAPTKAVGPEAVVVAQAQTAGPTGSPLAESVRNTIDMFMKRLHEVNSSGGSIATDPVVLSLYQNLTAMQPQLLKQIDDVQQQKAKQIAVLNKLNEAKEARVTLNKMRRDHLDKVKQMEQEQAMLARMQMEQKLALLRQQKQEQLEFQQSLQAKRLEVLHSQRAEYEQRVAMQREIERQQLIAQEQKVLQHQFGGGSPQPVRRVTPPTMMTQQFHVQQQPELAAPPPPPLSLEPSSLPLQSLSLHDPMSQQALPLPTKLEYNPTSMDSIAPPPYNPGAVPLTLQQDTMPSNVYTPYQAPPASQNSMPIQTGYTTHQSTLDPALSFTATGQSPSLTRGKPPGMVPGAQLPSMAPGQPPSMTSGQPPSMQPPSMAPGQPPSMQPPSMAPGQPLSMQPPSMASVQPPPPGQLDPGNMQLSGFGTTSSMAIQQPPPPPPSQVLAGPVGVAQPPAVPIMQYQDPPPPSTHTGYQGYQTQYPQQPALGGMVPNGAHQPRRESEPPLISFD